MESVLGPITKPVTEPVTKADLRVFILWIQLRQISWALLVIGFFCGWTSGTGHFGHKLVLTSITTLGLGVLGLFIPVAFKNKRRYAEARVLVDKWRLVHRLIWYPDYPLMGGTDAILALPLTDAEKLRHFTAARLYLEERARNATDAYARQTLARTAFNTANISRDDSDEALAAGQKLYASYQLACDSVTYHKKLYLEAWDLLVKKQPEDLGILEGKEYEDPEIFRTSLITLDLAKELASAQKTPPDAAATS